MKKYVALLRGINIGGKNKIKMSELKSAFEMAGLTEVRTVLNSGNIIFSSEADMNEEIQNENPGISDENQRVRRYTGSFAKVVEYRRKRQI